MLALILSLIVAISGSTTAGDSSVVLASRSFSLENRYDNSFVNEVFKYNILLTLKYMGNSFTLKPGEAFAFHDQILPEFQGSVVKTTNAHFNYQDGFRSDGDLYGDGVCHLASLMYWAARDAGLIAISPVDHDFAKINEIPKEYGVSIKFMPGDFAGSSRQNLYIVNNLQTAVTFNFNYDRTNLKVNLLQAEKI